MDFGLAMVAFEDPFATVTQDRDVEGEQRYQLIGSVFGRIILVAYAIAVEAQRESPDGDVVRIISARKATPAERSQYEENPTH